MKTKRRIWIKLSVALVISVVATAGILYSCEKQEIQPMDDGSMVKTDSDLPPGDIFDGRKICGQLERRDLIIDGVGRVGNVFVFNGPENFYVYVTADRNFVLKDAYLFAGTRAELPLNMDGDLEFKRFQHQIIKSDFQRTRIFRIPVSEIHGNNVVSLMVQAKNKNDGTRVQKAWAEGKNYGTIAVGHAFTYTKKICLVNDPVGFDE